MILGSDYFIRPYQTGDEDAIVEILDLCFDGWPSFELRCLPREHWEWKYLDNPSGKGSILVATSNDSVIGVNHFLPRRIKVFNKTIKGVYPADTVVHPDFRGMGVSTALRKTNIEDAKKKGFRYSYTVTSNPILIKSFEKIRPRFPHKISNLVRIIDINKQLKAMPVKRPVITKWGYLTVNMLNSIQNKFESYNSSVNGNLKTINLHSFDHRFQSFLNELMTEHQYIVERSINYLNWRYCDPRSGEFIVKTAEENNKIVGFITFTINKIRKEYPIGVILDLLALDNRIDVLHRLVSEALTFYEKSHVNIITSQVISNHPVAKALKTHSFLDSRINLHMFCNPFDFNEFSELKNIKPRKLYHSYGDIDSLPTNIPIYANI